MTETVTIDRRYRGPLESANGGYAAGLLGCRIGPAAEVTLRLPPPLERPLEVRRDGERLLLLDGDRLVAEAVRADPGLTPPRPPTMDEASAASSGVGAWGPPQFAECFVCGIRDDGSGLGIHPRPGPGTGWAGRDDLGRPRGRPRGRLGRDRLPRRVRGRRGRARRARTRPDDGARRPASRRGRAVRRRRLAARRGRQEAPRGYGAVRTGRACPRARPAGLAPASLTGRAFQAFQRSITGAPCSYPSIETVPVSRR